MIALPIKALIVLPIPRSRRNPSVATKGGDRAGLLWVLSNAAEWKSAATVALVFFVGSIALATTLTWDQKKLAAEINSETLKAAAAIKISQRLPNRIRD